MSTYLLIMMSSLDTDEPLMFDAFTIILYFLFSLNFSLVKETLVNMMVRSELRSLIFSSVFVSIIVISILHTGEFCVKHDYNDWSGLVQPIQHWERALIILLSYSVLGKRYN